MRRPLLSRSRLASAGYVTIYAAMANNVVGVRSRLPEREDELRQLATGPSRSAQRARHRPPGRLPRLPVRQ